MSFHILCQSIKSSSRPGAEDTVAIRINLRRVATFFLAFLGFQGVSTQTLLPIGHFPSIVHHVHVRGYGGTGRQEAPLATIGLSKRAPRIVLDRKMVAD